MHVESKGSPCPSPHQCNSAKHKSIAAVCASENEGGTAPTGDVFRGLGVRFSLNSRSPIKLSWRTEVGVWPGREKRLKGEAVFSPCLNSHVSLLAVEHWLCSCPCTRTSQLFMLLDSKSHLLLSRSLVS